MFTETNPDKGTETASATASDTTTSVMFTETNPDKGTETDAAGQLLSKGVHTGLQKLTPIRGRKQLFQCLRFQHSF